MELMNTNWYQKEMQTPIQLLLIWNLLSQKPCQTIV